VRDRPRKRAIKEVYPKATSMQNNEKTSLLGGRAQEAQVSVRNVEGRETCDDAAEAALPHRLTLIAPSF